MYNNEIFIIRILQVAILQLFVAYNNAFVKHTFAFDAQTQLNTFRYTNDKKIYFDNISTDTPNT